MRKDFQKKINKTPIGKTVYGGFQMLTLDAHQMNRVEP